MKKGMKCLGKKSKKSVLTGIVSFVFCFCIFSTTAFAASKTYSTYYSMKNACWSKEHSASATPTVTITTSEMVGNSNDKLWIEVSKKYWYGWAAPGSSQQSKVVSSVNSSTCKLKGNGAGTYRIGFMKYSYVIEGKTNKDNKTWKAKLKIKYNK